MSDIPPPIKRRNNDPLSGQREHERLSIGSFFAEHKAMTDVKRDHLGRLGMDPRHVEALRMPDLGDTPMPVMGTPVVDFVHAAPLEADNYESEYKPKRLPKALEE